MGMKHTVISLAVLALATLLWAQFRADRDFALVDLNSGTDPQSSRSASNKSRDLVAPDDRRSAIIDRDRQTLKQQPNSNQAAAKDNILHRKAVSDLDAGRATDQAQDLHERSESGLETEISAAIANSASDQEFATEYNFIDLPSILQFLSEKNLESPEQVSRTKLSSTNVQQVQKYLNGRFWGLIKHSDVLWQMNLDVQGNFEPEFIEGSIELNILDENQLAIITSSINGMINQNVSVEQHSDHIELRIVPSPDDVNHLIQLFPNFDQPGIIAGNLYLRQSSGRLSQAMPFVLERTEEN